MRGVEWSGKQHDPIKFDMLVSDANRSRLSGIQEGSLGEEVIFNFIVYKWDAERAHHFKAVLTSTPRRDENVLVGVVSKPGIFVDKDPFRTQWASLPRGLHGIFSVIFSADPQLHLLMRCTIDTDSVGLSAPLSLIWGDEFP